MATTDDAAYRAEQLTKAAAALRDARNALLTAEWALQAAGQRGLMAQVRDISTGPLKQILDTTDDARFAKIYPEDVLDDEHASGLHRGSAKYGCRACMTGEG